MSDAAIKNNEIILQQQPYPEKDALEIIEKRLALFDRLMGVAIKTTSQSDWIDQNGKPYLQGSGAEKVARRFAVRIFDTVIEREELQDEKGRYYMYTAFGKFSLSERDTIDAVGTCSSRDPFFSKGGKVETADIDMGNIKKSAYTNCIVNGITKLLGLRNLTWEDLSRYGIGRDGKATVKYDKGASKAAATKSADNAEKGAKAPYWTSEYNGKNYIYARVGKHYSEEFIKNLGLQKSKNKEGLWFSENSQQIENALREECEAAEFSIREEAANGSV